MSIFDGIFGTMGGISFAENQRRQFGNRQPSGCGNMNYIGIENTQAIHAQRLKAFVEYNSAQGIPILYMEGLQNNITVECLYCRTPRESRHKTCKGCGATEARRV